MSWRRLSAVVPAGLDDEVASVLGGGSLGVEILPAGAGFSEVRVYLGLADDPEAWRRRAEGVLAAHGVEARLALDDVADEAWVARWQASLAPIPLGTRFVVLPNASGDVAPGKVAIRLVPGMAFGTGEHETTRMCAAALEAVVRPGSRWLDLGCGTGILAVVAAECGAREVVAVDVDPEAAHVAQEVVAAHGASSTVRVRAGSLDDAGDAAFDGIVANIQSSFFLGRGESLAARLAPGGALVLSGFLLEDAPEVAEALGRHGMALRSTVSEGPWACLTLTRARP